MKLIYIAVVALAVTLLSSCTSKKQDPKPALQTFGSVTLKLEHSFGLDEFSLNSPTFYKNDSEDSLIFTTLKYYISNLKFKKSDGTEYVELDSYYLVDFANATNGVVPVVINNVPSGDYDQITFTIGVDSLRNVSGAQTGALDPANGMFWNWTNGYIFLKAEGTFENVTSGSFHYHIGGFQNSNGTNALQNNVFDLGLELLTINPSASPQVHFAVDVKSIFDGGVAPIKVADLPMIMAPSANAVTVSSSYASMIEFEHVHN